MRPCNRSNVKLLILSTIPSFERGEDGQKVQGLYRMFMFNILYSFRFFIQAEVKVTKSEHIDDILQSETRQVTIVTILPVE